MARNSYTLSRQVPSFSQSQPRVCPDWYTHLLIQKNKRIADLEKRIADLEKRYQPVINVPTNDDIFQLKILKTADWSRFCQRFEQKFPGFLYKLKQHYPELSQAESRLFLLLMLKFENQKIADTVGISLESVWRTRHRLSQKLQLSSAAYLDCFVAEFGACIEKNKKLAMQN